jgi:hypothetical protein
MVSLIKNNVKIRVTRRLSAGVCKLICRYFSSTALQRLNAKDMAWLVGFFESEGSFSIYQHSGETYKSVSFEVGQTKGAQIIDAIRVRLSLNANPYADIDNCVRIKSTSSRGLQNVCNFWIVLMNSKGTNDFSIFYS